MWKLHQKFGKLEWEDLIEPSIKIAEEGVVINKAFAKGIESAKRKIEQKGLDFNPGLK